MAVDVIMPRVDMTMERGTIRAWKAAPGDAVREGALLFEIETDKSAMEIDAPASGTLGPILVPAGVEVPVGTVVARILAAGETAEAGVPQAAPAPHAAGAPIGSPAFLHASNPPDTFATSKPSLSSMLVAAAERPPSAQCTRIFRSRGSSASLGINRVYGTLSARSSRAVACSADPRTSSTNHSPRSPLASCTETSRDRTSRGAPATADGGTTATKRSYPIRTRSRTSSSARAGSHTSTMRSSGFTYEPTTIGNILPGTAWIAPGRWPSRNAAHGRVSTTTVPVRSHSAACAAASATTGGAGSAPSTGTPSRFSAFMRAK